MPTDPPSFLQASLSPLTPLPPLRSTLATPSATRAVLERWGLHAKKALGQHFLVDGQVIERIGCLAQVESSDTILEIGPGIGTLTVALLDAGAQVIAIERDSQLIDVLTGECRAVCAPEEQRLALLEMDATALSAEQLALASRSLARPEAPNKMVANLPYAVAATIVLDCLMRFAGVETFVVMVQREVADRMCARPGGKEYGGYSVKLALFGEVDASFPVSRGSFFPPPRVDSRVVRIERKKVTARAEVLEAACFSADAAFAQRRKTIRNSMRAFFASRDLAPDLADEALASAAIDPRSRGEMHEPEEFLAMGDFLVDSRRYPCRLQR